MTKAEAKRYVCLVLSESIALDKDIGADWLHFNANGDEHTSADKARISAAVEELYSELRRRAGD